MMQILNNLYIPFEFDSLDFEITHGDKIALLGSCFSDEIGTHLQNNGHDVLMNPFGTIFHPSPLAQNVLACFDADYQERILERDGSFYSWDCSSKINEATFEELQSRLKTIRNSVKNYLSSAKLLIVTLGTSWGYELKDTNEIVANCHKAPSEYFQKFLSSSYEMLQDWTICIEKLKEINPSLNILFTVSPVRHIRDGVSENNFSKARLIEISHQLSVEENISYFPSYEFVIDVLRDYRFFKKDGVHPTEQTVELVWKGFQQVAMSAATVLINNKAEKITQLKQHKTLSLNTDSKLKHEQMIFAKEEELKKLSPLVKL